MRRHQTERRGISCRYRQTPLDSSRQTLRRRGKWRERNNAPCASSRQSGTRARSEGECCVNSLPPRLQDTPSTGRNDGADPIFVSLTTAFEARRPALLNPW